jgi:hypothetical protein
MIRLRKEAQSDETEQGTLHSTGKSAPGELGWNKLATEISVVNT